MPVFEYQCECGKKMDVLVRGNEPATCDAALEASDWCSRGGKLSKLISAPYLSKSSGATFYNSHTGAESAASTECGHCGTAPGSCESD